MDGKTGRCQPEIETGTKIGRWGHDANKHNPELKDMKRQFPIWILFKMLTYSSGEHDKMRQRYYNMCAL